MTHIVDRYHSAESATDGCWTHVVVRAQDTVSVLSPEVPGLCINRSDYGPPVEGTRAC